MNVLDVNSVNLRNAYPTALGHTIGQAGSANNQSAIPTVNNNPTNADVATHAALTVGGQANPVIGGIVFLALIVGLSLVAKRVGSVDEFKNIRVSPYNVLIVSMAAIIGMPVWKYLFTRFPIPGVSTWVASA
jgi:hypothetical protein